MAPQSIQSQSARANPQAGVFGYPASILLLSLRWMVSTSWFLFLLAATLVGASLLLSLYTGAWHWFQRSGALLVSIGALLSTRRALGVMLTAMIAETGSTCQPAGNAPDWRSDMAELQTCVCGLAFVAMGTLIWAYGDLLECLLHWNSSCLI